MIQTLAMLGTDWLSLAPELILLVGAFLILMLDVFLPEHLQRLMYGVALGAPCLAVAALVLVATPTRTAFAGMMICDQVAEILKLVILIICIGTQHYAWSDAQQRPRFRGEVSVLILFAGVGMVTLVAAGTLLMAYLGLELLSLSTYALVASSTRHSQSTEAAIKYLVLGSLASGFVLYGISLIYGGTQTLDLQAIRAIIQQGTPTLAVSAGFVFVLAGLAFKLGIAPFHCWLADVYEGAPPSIGLLISSGLKLSAFALLYRLSLIWLDSANHLWSHLLGVLAVTTMLVGSLLALLQTQLLRLFAYSTVSQMGFILMGLACGTAQGMAAALFYVVAYAVMSTAAFGAVLVLSNQGYPTLTLASCRGLSKRHPWLAVSLLCTMASMTGIPPFFGFWAKVAVFAAVLRTGNELFVGAALVATALGAYYYFRVIQAIYFHDEPAPIPVNSTRLPGGRLLLAINALGLLMIGLFSNPFLVWCQQAFIVGGKLHQ